MDDNKQFWERFSRHYAGFMRRSQATYQQICKAMRPFLKRDMDVLELACGTGQLSVPLSPCVRSWEATDFSAEMIRQAKKAGLFVQAPFLRPGRYQAALRAGELRCGRDLQRPPCHASPGKSSGGSLAGSEAGGMAVRPHLCLGQKPKRQTPALVHGAFRLSGVSCLDCRELMAYLSERGYSIVRHPLLGSSLAPLCCLMARKIPDERPRHGRPPSGPRSSMIQKSRRSERTCGSTQWKSTE